MKSNLKIKKELKIFLFCKETILKGVRSIRDALIYYDSKLPYSATLDFFLLIMCIGIIFLFT